MQVEVNGLKHESHWYRTLIVVLSASAVSENKTTQVYFFTFPSLNKFFFLTFLSLPLYFRQTFANGQLKLEGKQEEGKGKCPFDPFQRYSSLMVGECLSQVYCQRKKGTKQRILLNVQSAPTEKFSVG